MGFELRRHMQSYGKEFDKIRDKVAMPSQQTTTTTTTSEKQDEVKKCHDETLEKELGDIHAQLEDAKRKYVLSLHSILYTFEEERRRHDGPVLSNVALSAAVLTFIPVSTLALRREPPSSRSGLPLFLVPDRFFCVSDRRICVQLSIIGLFSVLCIFEEIYATAPSNSHLPPNTSESDTK